MESTDVFLWKVVFSNLIGYEKAECEVYVVAANAIAAGISASEFGLDEETPHIKSIEFISINVILATDVFAGVKGIASRKV